MVIIDAYYGQAVSQCSPPVHCGLLTHGWSCKVWELDSEQDFSVPMATSCPHTVELLVRKSAVSGVHCWQLSFLCSWCCCSATLNSFVQQTAFRLTSLFDIGLDFRTCTVFRALIYRIIFCDMSVAQTDTLRLVCCRKLFIDLILFSAGNWFKDAITEVLGI